MNQKNESVSKNVHGNEWLGGHIVVVAPDASGCEVIVNTYLGNERRKVKLLDVDGLSLDAVTVRGLESPTEVPPLLKSLYVVTSHLLRSPAIK
jgi:hypothetical protein